MNNSKNDSCITQTRMAWSVLNPGTKVERPKRTSSALEKFKTENGWGSRENLIQDAQKAAELLSKPKTNSFKEKYSFKQSYFLKLLELTQVPSSYLEFGVAGGLTLKILDTITNSSVDCHGFDTFSGYPEPWVRECNGKSTLHRDIGENAPDDFGSYSCIEQLRNQKNVNLYEGCFQQTLPIFLKTFNRTGPWLVYLNADLFSSTLFVLAQLHQHLKENDIIVFHCSDERNEFAAIETYVSTHHMKKYLKFVLSEKSGWMMSFKVQKFI